MRIKVFLLEANLIELKDSKNYSVASFNSTIPTGQKNINSIIQSENSIMKKQMEAAGNNIKSLPIREVYYLIRGKNKKTNAQKIILIHGSFFETISKEKLISQSFLQALEERLKQSNIKTKNEVKKQISSLFSQQENFSKVRNVNNASVKLRFRIMTEVKAEGNILNTKKYPDILENSLNFILPYHKKIDREVALKKMRIVFNKGELKNIKEFKLKHHLNGYFLVFQKKI